MFIELFFWINIACIVSDLRNCVLDFMKSRQFTMSATDKMNEGIESTESGIQMRQFWCV